MWKKLTRLDPLVHLFFLVSIVILLAIVLKLDTKIKSLKVISSDSQPTTVVQTTGEELDEGEIKKWISQEVAKLSTITKTSTTQLTVPPTSKSTSTTYIPMTGVGRTSSSRDWYTIPASDFYLDLAGEYGSSATATWEATLKIEGGNGQAFVRIWDDTHKIGVGESEISTIGNAEYQAVYSRALQFWAGRNLYKLQIKSLTGYQVTFGGGKLKISY